MKPADAPVDPAQDPNLIRVFDAYGRELFITKEQWRTGVLPGTVASHWNDPDQLYGVIVGALSDGFRADVLDAARHLYQTDPQPMRGACIWGIVLMEGGNLDEAERVYRDFMAAHGESGVILTNLAKVYSKRNDDARSEQLLWHGLEIDPNQDNAVGWYWQLHRERGGDDAGEAALRRITQVPGSWRAQMWLARFELRLQHLDQALALYREAISRAGYPPPGDLLMQISGDLGNTGHLRQILLLIEPHFDPGVHGLQVGNNLLKANLDLGKLDVVRRLLDQLYSCKRPDWKETLGFWDTELAKARLVPMAKGPQAPLAVTMLSIDGPVWLKPDSLAVRLLPTPLPPSSIIAFLGGTAEVTSNSQRVVQQLADARGRMSRALPLFLAEQVMFASFAQVRVLVPWLVTPTPGFVLGRVAWSDDEAAASARQGDAPADYVVITHLRTQSERWTVELRLIRTIDGQRLGELSEALVMAQPSDAARALSRQTITLLAREAKVVTRAMPSQYQVPTAGDLATYLLRLEQLLAVRCTGMEGVPARILSGEREIIDGNVQQCLAYPASIPVRLLLAQTVLAMNRVRPDVVAESCERVELLQREHPLVGPAQAVVQGMLSEAFGN